jgi:hypothetical protein
LVGEVLEEMTEMEMGTQINLINNYGNVEGLYCFGLVTPIPEIYMMKVYKSHYFFTCTYRQ